MKQFLPSAFILIGSLAAAGCATKTYVKNSVDPVSGKLDQVAAQTNQQGQTLNQTNQSLDQTKQSLDSTRASLEKDETDINATNERAVSAGQRADDAANKADQIGKNLGNLRGVVANLDDYKQVASTTVNFAFDSDKLTPDGRQALDQMVQNQGQYKRYFIAVEGFTDSIGSTEYNAALSRRRADAVVEYMVGQHDIPVYRIHMVGLGKMKPADDAHTRAARAKNRRVEVSLFSADQNITAMNAPSGGTSPSSNPPSSNSAGTR